jgi:hypothetical protein
MIAMPETIISDLPFKEIEELFESTDEDSR